MARFPLLIVRGIAICGINPALATGGQFLNTVEELNVFTHQEQCETKMFCITATVIRADVTPTPQVAIKDKTGQALVVFRLPNMPKPGDIVELTGESRMDQFHEFWTKATQVRKMGTEPVASPLDIKIDDLDEIKHDQLTIRTEGTVISIFADQIDPNYTYAILKGEAVTIPVFTRQKHTLGKELLGARIRLTGEYTRSTIGNRKFSGPTITPSESTKIDVIRPAPKDPFDVRTLESSYYLSPREVSRLGARKLEGQVLATWGENRIMLRATDDRIVNIDLVQGTPLPHCQSMIIAVGYPTTDLFRINLSSAIWKKSDKAPLPPEAPTEVVTPDILTDANGRHKINNLYHGKLIRITGTVIGTSSGDGQGSRFLLDDGHSKIPVIAPACPDILKEIESGCTLAVTGRCMLETPNWSPLEVFPQIRGFSVIVSDHRQIRILARPPWLTTQRLIGIVAALCAIIIVIFVWNRVLAHIITMRSRQLYKAELKQAKAKLRVDERTRLSVELHDSISQNLTGIALEINAAGRKAKSDLPAALVHLSRSQSALKSCRDELRRCILDLRNNALDASTLDEAILQTLATYRTNAKLAVRFNVSRNRIDDNITHAILRIIRELVVNAIRHGKASEIKIAGTTEGRNILFSVRDNGCGFNPETAPGIAEGHFGLQGVRERIMLLNGNIKINSSIGLGTKISASIQLPEMDSPWEK